MFSTLFGFTLLASLIGTPHPQHDGHSVYPPVAHFSDKEAGKQMESVVKLDLLSSGLSVSSATGFAVEWDRKRKVTTILTNDHFCEDFEKVYAPSISMSDFEFPFKPQPIKPLTIIASDPTIDLCILETPERLPILRLARDKVTAGDSIRIIGAPYGTFPIILDTYVSGFIKADLLGGMVNEHIADIIMVSGIIYPGHSGSPVLNERGKVIGIIFIGIDSRRGTEYGGGAIPASVIRTFLEEK